jgi:hypothetical protein
MNSTEEPAPKYKNLGLWITVILEGLVIIAVGAYNIYEIRRNSELVQSKIEGLSRFSARQGEKLDRMVTTIELYVGKKFATDETSAINGVAAEQRIEKAIEFLNTMKKRKTLQLESGSEPIEAETSGTSPLAEPRR